MDQALSNRVAQAASKLRIAHSEALAAIQKELNSLQEQKLTAASDLEKKQARDFAITKKKASNAVLASHHSAINAAAALIQSGSGNEKQVAEYVEFGEISVNARNSGLSNELTVPMVIPLIGHENVAFLGDRDVTDDALRNLLLEAVLNTTIADLTLCVVNPDLRDAMAAFSGLTQVRDGLFSVINTDKDFQSELDSIRNRITQISNTMRGISGSVVYYARDTGFLPEPYRIITLLDYPYNISEQTHRQLLPILRAANNAGVSFVVQLMPKERYPDWFNEAELLSMMPSFTMSSGRAIWSGNKKLNVAAPSVSSANVVARLDSFITASQSSLEISLNDIIPQRYWTESSKDGITFAFAGENKRRLDVTMGDSLVHGLITGATGEGKSNLIKVMIYDLASRYSPDELELIMLDFKEGITLAPLAPSANSPDFLPHARILGLDADQEYGLVVLDEIERIYKRRMADMKPYDNIKAYRAANPDARMPRILIVVDEFQGLLAESEERIGQEASKLLHNLIRTVRAAGIHFVLATQEIGSIGSLIGKRDGLLSQIKLRVGLRNTSKEAAQAFDINNDAAARLKVKGEVVINTTFGDRDGNVIGRVPFAPDEILTELRVQWWNDRKESDEPPLVFDGAKLAAWDADWQAERLISNIESTPFALLGHPITVSQRPARFKFDRLPARNCAIVGAATDIDFVGSSIDSVGHPMAELEAAALSLAAQHLPVETQFLFWDMLSQQERSLAHVEMLYANLEAYGTQVTRIYQPEVLSSLVELYGQLETRTIDSPPIFVFGLSLDRIGSLDGKYEGTVKKMSQIQQELWERGPAVGIHFINWWSNGEVFMYHTNKQIEKYFNAVILFAGTNSVAKRVVGPVNTWNGHDRRALLRDFSSAHGVTKLIPYALPLLESVD